MGVATLGGNRMVDEVMTWICSRIKAYGSWLASSE